MIFIKKHWIFSLLVLILIILYPKNMGISDGGFLHDGQILKTSVRSCLGFSYKIYGTNPFGAGGCFDCPSSYYCVGIPFGKFTETCKKLSTDNGIPTMTPIDCSLYVR